MTSLPPFAAVVLAGGRAARLGGQPKPQLDVGGRTMLASVVDAVRDADPIVVVGPPQPVPDGVVLVREVPAGGGPVPALAAGLAMIDDAEVVAVLAADLPFLTRDLVTTLRQRFADDGVLVVDDTGRDQFLLGVWRVAGLRDATRDATPHMPLRTVLSRLSIGRHRPEATPGRPAPWTDCDTPADLARARAAPGRG